MIIKIPEFQCIVIMLRHFVYYTRMTKPSFLVLKEHYFCTSNNIFSVLKTAAKPVINKFFWYLSKSSKASNQQVFSVFK